MLSSTVDTAVREGNDSVSLGCDLFMLFKGQTPTQIFSKEKGVTSIDLLANHYQRLLQMCLTAVAAAIVR